MPRVVSGFHRQALSEVVEMANPQQFTNPRQPPRLTQWGVQKTESAQAVRSCAARWIRLPVRKSM